MVIKEIDLEITHGFRNRIFWHDYGIMHYTVLMSTICVNIQECGSSDVPANVKAVVSKILNKSRCLTPNLNLDSDLASAE